MLQIDKLFCFRFFRKKPNKIVTQSIESVSQQLHNTEQCNKRASATPTLVFGVVSLLTSENQCGLRCLYQNASPELSGFFSRWFLLVNSSKSFCLISGVVSGCLLFPSSAHFIMPCNVCTTCGRSE